jgi:ribose transport system substrate-binding protein
LSKAPPKGKTIISLENQTPSNFAVEAGMRQAAALLGWTFKTIAIPAGTEGVQQAFKSAITQRPDGIRVSGQPRAQYEVQIADAASKGITVVQDSSGDQPGNGLIDTAISNLPQARIYGQLMADWVIADSNGKAKVGLFNIPQFPSLTANADGFKAELSKRCPDCKVTGVDQQLADIGIKTPGAVTSLVQKSPDTHYLVFTLGDLSNGVSKALRAAGMQPSKYKLAGGVPTQEDLTALKNGDTGAWTAFAAPVMGWRIMDIFARHFAGDSVKPVDDSPLLPTQLLTKDNINTAVTDPSAMNWYVGVADYKDQFKKLWHVG